MSLMRLSHRVGGLTMYLIEFKPGNILFLRSDVGKIVMHDLPEQPGTICNFPKTTPPNDPPLFIAWINVPSFAESLRIRGMVRSSDG